MWWCYHRIAPSLFCGGGISSSISALRGSPFPFVTRFSLWREFRPGSHVPRVAFIIRRLIVKEVIAIATSRDSGTDRGEKKTDRPSYKMGGIQTWNGRVFWSCIVFYPTMVQNTWESICKYWVTRSSICSFTCTTHLFACSFTHSLVGCEWWLLLLCSFLLWAIVYSYLALQWQYPTMAGYW